VTDPGPSAAPTGTDPDVARAPADLRFPRTLRIRRRGEFLKVQREGRRYTHSRLTILYRQNGTEMSRLGVTVSKKVGNSPVRSRIKRVLREAFRLDRAALPAGLDIVLVARSELVGASPDDVRAILRLWTEAMVRRQTERGAAP
jgi:ribonuclease P protein component